MTCGGPITGLAAKPERVPIRPARRARNRSPSAPNRRLSEKPGRHPRIPTCSRRNRDASATRRRARDGTGSRRPPT